MRHLNYVFLVLLFLTTIANSETMYTLTGIKKGYPLVEISGNSVPKEYKKIIYDELKTVLDDLKIDTKGYDQRALAILVNETIIPNGVVVNLQMLVGEQVMRLDFDKKTFATTYLNEEYFILQKDDDLEDKLEDALDNLLTKFSEQYKEDNKVLVKVEINEDNFAFEMGYETNYVEAIKKGKKLHKNIMLVLVANYCPWCRKFEQRVLIKKDVNEIVQKNYIPLIINKETKEFPKEFDKSFTPIVHLIDYKTEQSYANVIGYNNRDNFVYLLKSDKHKN